MKCIRHTVSLLSLCICFHVIFLRHVAFSIWYNQLNEPKLEWFLHLLGCAPMMEGV